METFLIGVGIILLLPFLTSSPKTTVVLLENNLTQSAIDISTDTGSVTIDRPYHLTTLKAHNQNPSAVREANPAEIQEQFKTVLEALPSRAAEFLFYFEEGTAELTEESKKQVEHLASAIAKREPCAIDIIGHSDRVGDEEKNYNLALDRAEYVKNYLLNLHVRMERLDVVSYGENSPIVPTEDGVAEPKNRVVEVFVR